MLLARAKQFTAREREASRWFHSVISNSGIAVKIIDDVPVALNLLPRKDDSNIMILARGVGTFEDGVPVSYIAESAMQIWTSDSWDLISELREDVRSIEIDALAEVYFVNY